MSNDDYATSSSGPALPTARTGAERYLRERMRDPEYAAAYVKALYDLQKDELESHTFRLSSGQVCYLHLPPRIAQDDVERLQRFLIALALPTGQDDAGERG